MRFAAIFPTALALAATLPGASAAEARSADLLKGGFRLVAEGELLVGRAYVFDRMSAGGAQEQPFIAKVPGSARPIAEYVSWLGDRHEGYVRLKRDNEEFVCILSQPERCYRAGGLLRDE